MRTAAWRFRCVLLLALLPAAAFPFSPEPASTQAAPSSRVAQFDALFAKVMGPDSIDVPTDDYAAWLEQLRTLLPPGDPTREMRFRAVYCTSPRWKDPQQGLAYAEDALRRAIAAGDTAAQGVALFCRANFIQALHGTRAALAEANRMVALLEHSNERQLLGEALLLRGGLLSEIGEQARALIDFQRARAAFRAAGINREFDYAQLQTAIAYRRMGDYASAERYFLQAIKRHQDNGDDESLATTLIQLGYLYAESDKLANAYETFQRALAVAQRKRDDLLLGSAHLGMATVQIAQHQPDAALASLAQARRLFDAAQWHSNDGLLLLTTGQALAGKGQHSQALAYFQKALPIIQHDGNDRYLALLYAARSASAEALGQLKAALEDCRQHARLQAELQTKMRLQQSRLLDYEYEIRRRDFENQRLQTEAHARQLQLAALERERQWQALALILGGLLALLLALLAWIQWHRSRRLRVLAMTDPLTGIASRRALEKATHIALSNAHRKGQPLSVLLLDLDNFKNINDRYGHDVGDEVLRAVTATWQTLLRDHDVLGRLGGEEFAILCPQTTREQARTIAQRVLDATRALNLSRIDPGLHVTTSIGIAQARPDEGRESLFRRADAALYRAKQNGRNRYEED